MMIQLKDVVLTQLVRFVLIPKEIWQVPFPVVESCLKYQDAWDRYFYLCFKFYFILIFIRLLFMGVVLGLKEMLLSLHQVLESISSKHRLPKNAHQNY